MKDMEKIIEDSYYKAPSGYDGLANDKKFFSDTATALHQAGYRKVPTKEALERVVDDILYDDKEIANLNKWLKERDDNIDKARDEIARLREALDEVERVTQEYETQSIAQKALGK